MRRLLTAAAMLAAILVLFGIPACGKKSTQPRSSTGSTVPINSGTWEVTIQVNSTTGDCDNYLLGTVDTMFIDDGIDDFFADDCDYTITGSRFSHSCADTFYADSACVTVLSYTGGGTFTGTSFNSTFTLTVASTPAHCSTFPDCVLHLTITGRRIGNAPQVRARPAAPGARGFTSFLRKR